MSSSSRSGYVSLTDMELTELSVEQKSAAKKQEAQPVTTPLLLKGDTKNPSYGTLFKHPSTSIKLSEIKNSDVKALLQHSAECDYNIYVITDEKHTPDVKEDALYLKQKNKDEVEYQFIAPEDKKSTTGAIKLSDLKGHDVYYQAPAVLDNDSVKPLLTNILAFIAQKHECYKPILKAVWMAKQNHALILAKTAFTEKWCGGRQWQSISPLQYAAWAGDTGLVDAYLLILPNDLKQEALKQLNDVQNAYDLDIMSNGALQPNMLEFECKSTGICYRLIGLDGKEVKDTIPWSTLPNDFPKDDTEILINKDQLLPHLLAVTLVRQQTEKRFERPHLSAITELSAAYKKDETESNLNWSWNQRDKYWSDVITKKQSQSAVNLLQWFCSSTPFSPLPRFTAFPEARSQTVSYPNDFLFSTSAFGTVWGIFKGNKKFCTRAAVARWIAFGAQAPQAISQDFAAVSHFCNVRKKDLIRQITDLQNQVKPAVSMSLGGPR